LGVSCWPDDHFEKEYPQNKIKVVINVCEFDYPEGVPKGFIYYHFPVPDYGLPTQKQIVKFLEVTRKHILNKEAIVVHCVAGCGRTGQMIAIWAASTGRIPKGEDPIRWIRKHRACSCETPRQEKLVRNYVNKLRIQKK
jgi:protein-tyrosine phosphatase